LWQLVAAILMPWLSIIKEELISGERVPQYRPKQWAR
jgi:hypothetical protein